MPYRLGRWNRDEMQIIHRYWQIASGQQRKSQDDC